MSTTAGGPYFRRLMCDNRAAGRVAAVVESRVRDKRSKHGDSVKGRNSERHRCEPAAGGWERGRSIPLTEKRLFPSVGKPRETRHSPGRAGWGAWLSLFDVDQSISWQVKQSREPSMVTLSLLRSGLYRSWQEMQPTCPAGRRISGGRTLLGLNGPAPFFVKPVG